MAVVSHDFVLISRVDVWFVDNIVGSFDLSQVNGNNSVVPSYGLASINHLLELLIYVADEFLNFVSIVHVFDGVGLAVDSCFRRLNSSLYFLIIRVNNYDSLRNFFQCWSNRRIASSSTLSIGTNYKSFVASNSSLIVKAICINSQRNWLIVVIFWCIFAINCFIGICINTEANGNGVIFLIISSRSNFNRSSGYSQRNIFFCINVFYICSLAGKLIWNIRFDFYYFTNRRSYASFAQIKIGLIQLYTLDSILSFGTLGPGVLPLILIVGIQRHPDNVTWLEVNRLAVVQLGGGFLNDVTIFVSYKQLAIELEVGRPVCFVIRASAILNSKSVSAHAQYHSRSQCYGKYFFHSLSSS